MVFSVFLRLVRERIRKLVDLSELPWESHGIEEGAQVKS